MQAHDVQPQCSCTDLDAAHFKIADFTIALLKQREDGEQKFPAHRRTTEPAERPDSRCRHMMHSLSAAVPTWTLRISK